MNTSKDQKDQNMNTSKDHKQIMGMKDQKHTLGMWFRSLRRTSQISLIVALIGSVAIVAYAASVLFNTAHQSTNLSKERYVEVEITGAEAEGTIKPGDSVALAPVLTNQGDVNATAIIRVSMPTVNGTSAYDYEINRSWTEIESDESSGVFVCGFGTGGELTVLSPGSSTDPLVESGFTMRSDITGAEFNAMGSVDVSIDGYLVEAEAGTDPGTVWGMLGQ